MAVDNGELRRRETDSGEYKDVEQLAKCILQHFERISSERLHELAFLSEYIHYEENKERISSAEYKLVLDSCHSEELSSVVDDLEEVEQKHITISGESVNVLVIDSLLDCNLSDEYEEAVEYIVEKYGTVSPDTIDKVIRNLPVYQETTLGGTLDFERYLEG